MEENGSHVEGTNLQDEAMPEQKDDSKFLFTHLFLNTLRSLRLKYKSGFV